MEYEIRFYFSKNELESLFDKLNKIDVLIAGRRLYEKTIQYDHPSHDMSFYDEKVDGRFRIRVSKNDEYSNCKISWKRRIPTTTENDINKEEECELSIKPEEYENLIFIVDTVLKMKRVESYERYRTIYSNEEIEISIDEYPFGIALEIESKQSTNPEEIIRKWASILNFNVSEAYRLSWDDKYLELCNNQNVKAYKHVLFDLPMPEIGGQGKGNHR